MNIHLKNAFAAVAGCALIAGPFVLQTLLELLK